MESFEPKKLALLRVLQILEKHSDAEHPLKQEDIARCLEDEYGIIIERKAIGRNLSLLKEAGYDIASTRAGSYLCERDFTESELRVLIDGVLSSRHISSKYSKDLIKKLCGLSNEYFSTHVKHICSVDEWNKTENKEFFYNIEVVDRAIASKRRISFDYNKYGTDKKIHKTRSHICSPYQLILHNQRYYLFAFEHYWNSVSFYRLDHITNARVIADKARPLTSVEGYENGMSYKNIATALPYLYTDAPTIIEFTADEGITDQIIDWFGRDIRVIPCGEGKIKVTVSASPRAMEHWALQYAGYVTVTAPEHLVKAIKTRLKTAAGEYNKQK